jgi:outer membrane protein
MLKMIQVTGLLLFGALAVPAVPALAEDAETPAEVLAQGDALVVDDVLAVEIALRDYPGLARERERTREEGFRTKEAWSAVYPKIDARASFVQRQDPAFGQQPGFENLPGAGDLPPEFFEPVKSETWDYRLAVDQLLYSFGKVGKGIKAARANEKQVGFGLRDQELVVARNAALATYALARAEVRIAVIEAEKASLERQVRQAKDFLEIGTGTRLQLLQAQAALSALRPREIEAEGRLESSRAALNEALGRMPLGPISVIPNFLRDAELPDLPPLDRLVELAAARADLQALAQNRDVLSKLRGVEKANHLPEIKFLGSYGVRTFRTETLFDNEFVAWDAGVYLEWNLFDGFATRSRVRQIDSQVRQSQYQTRTRQGELARDLVAAMEDYERAREAGEAAREAIEQAEEARRVAVEQRTWGAATMIEVLEAERILTETRFQRLEAVHDALVALAELHYLVGILPGEEFLLSEETS